MTQVREEWCIRRGKGVNAAWKRSECGVEKAADPMRKRHAFDGEKAAEQAKPEQKKGLAAFFKKKRWNLALYLSLAFGIELLQYFK